MEEETEGKTRRKKSNRRKVNHISASMKIENKKTYFRNYGILSFSHFASLHFQYFLYYV